MKRIFMHVACLGALALATTTCGEDFTPYNRLLGLRVLAIQSQPVSPAFGETTTLTPLVFAPPGEVVSYSWSWCPLAGPSSQNAPCLVPEAQIAGILGSSVPAYDLGTAPTATFTNNIPNAWLAQLCQQTLADAGAPAENSAFDGGADDGGVDNDGGVNDSGIATDAGASKLPALPPGFLPKCTNGFPVQIKMVATSKKGDVITDTVTTIRTLDLSFDPAALPNTNPTISGLTAQLLKRDEDRNKDIAGDQPDGALMVLDDLGKSTVLRQRDIRLKVDVPLQSAEPSMDRDERDQPIMSSERLFISWFVESGTTEEERTGFIKDKTDLAKALKNIWRPASMKKFPGPQSKVVVVVRDSRGGVAWTSGTANLMVGPL